MSVPLYLYPGYQTIQCLADPEHRNSEQWLTFWITACTMEQLPLPWWVSTPALTLMYLPDTTDFVRNKLWFPAVDFVNGYVPVAKEKAFELVEKYRPRRADGEAQGNWWKFW